MLLLLLFSHSVVSNSLPPHELLAHQASLSNTNSVSLLKLMSIESMMPSNCLILCYLLLLLPSIFPSIRVFSNKLALCIRWTNYWSFSFSISSSNEYSGLISFRMDWFDFLAVQETLKSLCQQSINSLVLSHACIDTHTHTYINTYVICLFGVRHGHVNCFGS